MAYTTIDDPSAFFQTALYTGNGTAIGSGGLTVTNDGNSDLQPDWIWHKNYGAAESHAVADTNRGTHKGLFTNENSQESTGGSQYVNSFNTDGFTVGNVGWANDSGQNYVAWQWKCNGGTTSSNSDGDITATVQANTTAGFSIVTYTGNGNGSDQTVGHGLGAECKLVFQKMRTDAGQSWRVFHESVSQSGGGNLFLNSNGSLDTGDPARIKSTNTSTFTLLAYTSPYNGVNASGKEYLAYCFAEKQGYSKIGSFTGNGNADGAFVYTGFKPAWLMIKRTDSANHFLLFDIKRDTFNVGEKWLRADTNDAASTGIYWDGLSNGFKARTNDPIINASGGTYIYMAFAGHPFVSSKGVPVTAR